jgi:hypothetical protein
MDEIDVIVKLIKKDCIRLQILQCVHQLELPQCYLAAGFLRNLVWDFLHEKVQATPLNDVDVVYFDLKEVNPDQYLQYERVLKALMPQVNWQVRNQALMHVRNGDGQYKSLIDAMSYWPEQETAIAVRQVDEESFECVASFGFESLFNLQITHNPKRSMSVFESRINIKGWLSKWPRLVVVS